MAVRCGYKLTPSHTDRHAKCQLHTDTLKSLAENIYLQCMDVDEFGCDCESGDKMRYGYFYSLKTYNLKWFEPI